ncbi:pathogenesis-related thaumatin-like protein 3.5 [Salvia miltiorrhiza]|uniref:pathogenesis-related thaumatin-like protein 3.5 n=1 Tax=Salvia miltiorrhiza TaxID=226208 RepID=UPI0025ACED0F|nr:pathogenesis-related thaumatin-like protein 3.5 [Salvia miltiorrhiza]
MALVINHLGTFLLIVFLFVASSGVRVSKCTKFTIINNCNETIWPGIHPSNFSTGGFGLRPNQSAVFSPPPAWHGRIWARTACDFTHNGTCQTGGCGPSLQCTGPGQPPASIAEFALGGDIDYYDVSLVDGFNLPLLIVPLGGKGNCSSAGCDVDLRPDCPPELAMRSGGKVVACRSACNAFDTDEYCCRAAFSTPMRVCRRTTREGSKWPALQLIASRMMIQQVLLRAPLQIICSLFDLQSKYILVLYVLV